MKTIQDNYISVISHQFKGLTPDQVDAVVRALSLLDRRIKQHQLDKNLDKADQQLVVLGLAQSRLELKRVLEAATQLSA